VRWFQQHQLVVSTAPLHLANTLEPNSAPLIHDKTTLFKSSSWPKCLNRHSLELPSLPLLFQLLLFLFNLELNIGELLLELHLSFMDHFSEGSVIGLSHFDFALQVIIHQRHVLMVQQVRVA